MNAVLEILGGGAVFIGTVLLAWHIASVIEARRYLRSRQPRRPFVLRIAFRRRKLPSNVYRFPERNRAS